MAQSLAMKPLVVLLCCLLFCAPSLRAQVETYHLDVPRRSFSETFSPFASVEVLDNRVDTARLYTIESGTYPPLSVTFDTSVQAAVQAYMNLALVGVKRGDAHLLVRIDRMGTANADLRLFFVFHATAYVRQADNTYMPLLRVKKVYKNMRAGPTHIVGEMCSQLLEAAGAAYAQQQAASFAPSETVTRLMRDTAAFIVARPGPSLTLAQIQTDPVEGWKRYPILQQIPLVSGVYPTFRDFRANRVQATPVRMIFREKDSLYAPDRSVGRHPWAICDGHDLYMRLHDDGYVLLDREETGVYFYVPRSTPDMYALLTRTGDLHYAPATAVHVSAGGYVPLYIPPISGKGRGGGGGDVKTGDALLIVGGLIVVGIAAAIIVQAAQKHAAIRRGLQGDYRFCTVDMDSGDVLYSSEDYPFRP